MTAPEWAAEWVTELAETLAHRGHGLAQMTVASYRDAAGRDQVIAIARRAAATVGWPVYELSATRITEQTTQAPEAGLLILRDVDVPLPIAIPVMVGAFQHLVQRDLPVVLLVVGTTRGIRALRKTSSMGFLSRAESVIQTLTPTGEAKDL